MAFEINDEFVPKSKVISLMVPDEESQQKKLIAEAKSVEGAVKADRKIHVESKVMKVMKKEKKLECDAVVSQVQSLLQFPHDDDDIKASIETLVLKSFLKKMKRASEDPLDTTEIPMAADEAVDDKSLIYYN